MNHTLKSILAFPFLALDLFAKDKKAGGQAIIEGVMMRRKAKVAWAVRKPDGTMALEETPFVSASEKTRLFKLPVMRGALGLYESLVLGYRALTRSAELAVEENEKPATEEEARRRKRNDAIASALSFAAALLITIGLFMYAPMWVLSKMVPEESAFLFNTLSGILRILLFLAYLVLISLWSEMRRVFEYHGAEHKAIYAFEDDKELSLENMRPYTTLHPRCGTSFLLLVGIICIILFSVVDAAVISLLGPYPHVSVRLAVHLLLIPLVAGSSYEVLKLSDRYRHIPIVGALILPGLWLQKITTRTPDDRQLETAAAALKAVI